MNELQVSICKETVEAAQHMPTDAVIDLIKEGYRSLALTHSDVREAMEKVLQSLEAIVDSRTQAKAEPVAWCASTRITS